VARLWADELAARGDEVDASDWDDGHPEGGFLQIAAACTSLADLASEASVQESLYAISGGFEEVASDHARKDQPDPEPEWAPEDFGTTRSEDREMSIERLFDDL
jgi:hypothetical protein